MADEHLTGPSFHELVAERAADPYRSPGNPHTCDNCGHLPAAHEDGRGGLGSCWARPARERRWWQRRGCTCPRFIARPVADRG